MEMKMEEYLNNVAEILVVDDTTENLKLLSPILSENGYNVRLSPSGDLALRSVAVKLPDIILLDIRMPEMDGFELCEKLKSDEKSKDIPVIFVSAMDDVRDKVRAFKAGAVDYITKPFESEEILVRISTHITMRRLQNDLKSQNIKLKLLMQKQKEQEHMMIEQSKMAAMGEMISAIAHQWRQPLNTLGLYIQDLELAYETDDINETYVHKLVSNSMRQINYMSATIDDFRSFFTPNKNKVMFSVTEQINKTVELLYPQLKVHNIGIELRDVYCMIFGYSNEFKQVVLNIVNNSKDAIILRQKNDSQLRGSIQIIGEKTDLEYKITFRDNGGGIDEKYMDKIFEPYFSTKFPTSGTGIGLYMVKEIISRHYNGSVSVKNIKDGAEFVITIPICQSESDDA